MVNSPLHPQWRHPYCLIVVGVVLIIAGGLWWWFTFVVVGIWILGIGIVTMALRSLKDQNEEMKRHLREHDLTRHENHVDAMAFVPGKLRLGKKKDGSIASPSAGITIERDGMACLDWSKTYDHILVVGTTGAGKSYYAMNWLIHETLHNTERKVIVVEAKGDLDFDRSVAHRIASKRGPVPLFLLGHHEKGTLYDCFRGSGEAIKNRLIMLADLPTMDESGDTAFFAGFHRAALDMVCMVPGNPPKDWGDVFERLKMSWLKDNWGNDPYRKLIIERMEAAGGKNNQGYVLDGLIVKIGNFVSTFHQYMGAGGFALEDYRGAMFSMKSGSSEDDTNRVQRVILSDLHDLMGNPKRQGGHVGEDGRFVWTPMTVIIDEFTGLTGQEIVLLLRQARGFNINIILSVQDETLLSRTPNDRQLILSNIGTFIIMRTNYPETFVTIGGTKAQLEPSIQYKDGNPTGSMTVREGEEYLVNPNTIRYLPDGDAVVIRQNHAWRVKIPTAPKVVGSDSDIVVIDRKVAPIKDEPATEPVRKPGKRNKAP